MARAEIDVEELRGNRSGYLLLDVREPEELNLASLPATIHIPLGELTRRFRELPDDRPLAVLCHHGVRSGHAAEFLSGVGYDAFNVAGGIDAWSQRVDPGVPRY